MPGCNSEPRWILAVDARLDYTAQENCATIHVENDVAKPIALDPYDLDL